MTDRELRWWCVVFVLLALLAFMLLRAIGGALGPAMGGGA